MVSVLSKASKKIEGQNNTAFNGNQTQDLVIASHSLNRCATVQSLHLSQQLYNMAHKTAQSCITPQWSNTSSKCATIPVKCTLVKDR